MSVGLLAASVGCGRRTDDISDADFAESTQTEKEDTAQDTIENYVKEGVDLPDGFDNMIYVLESLTVSKYVQGYSYYTEGNDKEAFWFPMAVLSSLISEKEEDDSNYDNGKYYYSKDQIDTFASGLFKDYSLGKMELPEVDDESQVVVYEEDTGEYGLLSGNIGDLSVEITSCESNNDIYYIKADLINAEENIKLAGYEVEISPLEGNSLFNYTVADCVYVDGEDSAAISDDSQTDQFAEPSAETDYDEVDGVEITDDFSEEDSEIYEEDQDEEAYYEEDQEISRIQALELAKAYMGEDAQYKYKQMVTVGDYEYFDFSVKGKDIQSTDVLVCIDGNDVVGAIQNEDGSWTFDQ